MVAERLVADMRSLHGWQYWAAVWLGCITETLSNDQQPDLNTLVDVADEGWWAVMMARMNAEVFLYACSLTPISLKELSRSCCEHDTLALEKVNRTIVLRAAPVVVLESCERYFDSVCLNMFGLAQRVHILSFRTAHLAALAHLAATVPCKLDSREGYRQWWRVLLENDKLNPGSMSKDMQVLTRKDLRQLSCFDSCWYWSVLAESTVFPGIITSCPTNSCVATWSWLS